MRLFSLAIGLCLLSFILCQSEDAFVEDEYNEEDDSADLPLGSTGGTETSSAARVVYRKPKADASKGSKIYFEESFDSGVDLFKTKWFPSQAKRSDGGAYTGPWKIEQPSNPPMIGDLGLVMKKPAQHYAIASAFDEPFKFGNSPLVVQYEVQFQDGITCGGSYIKLATHSENKIIGELQDKTPYTIMFGPDKCGNDDKLHLIFRYKNKKTGEIEEKHSKKPDSDLGKLFSDRATHLYTLEVNPDSTYKIWVDQSLVKSGSLLSETDITPPFLPPKEIDDPSDKKPKDWDERAKIADPEAKKPEDWDETQPEMIVDSQAVKPDGWLEDVEPLIADPNSAKPDDWDDSMDGEWEAPQIDNPACVSAPGCGKWSVPEIKNPLYKGKWKAPLIDNPAYQGIWKPKRISNPAYFEDPAPFKSLEPISAVGLELWTMSGDVLFDNFIVTDSKAVADDYASQTWAHKYAFYRSNAQSVFDVVADVFTEKPWLVAVIVICVILPLFLVCIYCCCFREGEPVGAAAQQKSFDKHRKKTDEPVPDTEDFDDMPPLEDQSSSKDVEEEPIVPGEHEFELEGQEVEEQEKQEVKQRKKPRKD